MVYLKRTRCWVNYLHDYIPEDNQRLCKVVIDAKKSLLARLRLVLSKNLKHDTLNKTITKKLEILFGND